MTIAGFSVGVRKSEVTIVAPRFAVAARYGLTAEEAKDLAEALMYAADRALQYAERRGGRGQSAVDRDGQLAQTSFDDIQKGWLG
ncbi:hypothetical protein [Mycobacterium sp. ACS4331]|uniref:hypothetical protein n=1 Tax=Mycobacterium sp. ACS4331 TaxID=1834121 RepID=UPI0007FD7932|nr:hypothetical protein [Mycobacterium sp. ACS4331]OBF29660.1 hypothetical protein A5727_23580 [Mycobacterium sp. ACS4331]